MKRLLAAALLLLTLVAAPRGAQTTDLDPPRDVSAVPRPSAGLPGAPPQGVRVAPGGAVGSGNGSADRRVSGGAPSPAARAEVGTALSVARGWATWYDDGAGFYGAVPSWRFGDDPYAVQVCLLDRPATCTHVVIRDFCACGDRHSEPTVIDLSPAAFRELTPLIQWMLHW